MLASTNVQHALEAMWQSNVEIIHFHFSDDDFCRQYAKKRLAMPDEQQDKDERMKSEAI